MTAPPCVLCGKPLPHLFSDEYPPRDVTEEGTARCWCCPACVLRHGWRGSYARALSLIRSRQTEVTP